MNICRRSRGSGGSACQKRAWPFFDKRLAVCRAHNLFAESEQIPHLQTEKCFLRRTRRRKKRVALYLPPAGGKLCEAFLTDSAAAPAGAAAFCALLWIRRAEAFDQNGPVKWKYWKNTEIYTEYSWKIFPGFFRCRPPGTNKHKCACIVDGISGAEKGRLTFWRICTTRTLSLETVHEISTKNNGSFITVM